MYIKVSADDKEVLQVIEGYARRLSNMRPAMLNIGEAIRTSVERNFAAGGRPPWEPSARVKLAGGETLSDTGRLRRSLTVRAGERSVAVGTNVKYAAVHQFGAKKGSFGTVTAHVREHIRKIAGKEITVKAHTREQSLPWGTIPARPFLMEQDEDRAEINHILIEHITGRLGGLS